MAPQRRSRAPSLQGPTRVAWKALALLVAAPAWAHGQEPAAAYSAVADPNGTLRVFLRMTWGETGSTPGRS